MERSKSSSPEQGNNFLAKPREAAIESLDAVSEFVRDASRKLRKSQAASGYAEYTDKFADKLDAVSRSIRDVEWEEVLTNTKNFSREHPEVIVAGMFVAGLFAGRMLRAAKPSFDFMSDERSATRRSSKSKGSTSRKSHPAAQRSRISEAAAEVH